MARVNLIMTAPVQCCSVIDPLPSCRTGGRPADRAQAGFIPQPGIQYQPFYRRRTILDERAMLVGAAAVDEITVFQPSIGMKSTTSPPRTDRTVDSPRCDRHAHPEAS